MKNQMKQVGGVMRNYIFLTGKEVDEYMKRFEAMEWPNASFSSICEEDVEDNHKYMIYWDLPRMEPLEAAEACMVSGIMAVVTGEKQQAHRSLAFNIMAGGLCHYDNGEVVFDIVHEIGKVRFGVFYRMRLKTNVDAVMISGRHLSASCDGQGLRLHYEFEI